MHLPSEGNLFIAKPEPLGDLLSGIHRHKTALPNFQRPWVWEPDMVKELIVSVAFRYPAGSLLTMPVSAVNFALRPFEPWDELKDKPSLMILDGQQRLTSLYQAMYRRDGVQVKNRTYFFYLDVAVLLSDPDGIDEGPPYFEKALFYVAEDRNGKRVRYEGLHPKYELTTRQQELAAGALPLGCIFDPDGYLSTWRKDYLIQQSKPNDLSAYIALDGEWSRLVQPWLDRIRNYPFPVVELRPDMPLAAICHIFEKVNSTGVPLDVFDLCTAILWSQGFALNQEWAKTAEHLKTKLPMQPLSGTYFLQGLSVLASLDRKRSNTAAAITCRKQDLMAMSAETVKKWWRPLVDGYQQAGQFLTDQGIMSERLLPYSTLIVPLAAILADVKSRKGTVAANAAWPAIERWYWCSVFTQRYSSQVETVAAQDFEEVIGWIDGGKEPEAVRTFGFRSDSLQEITSIRNAIYKGVLCLLVRSGARDFGGSGKLSTAIFYDTGQDHHHIFPTDALKKLGIQDPRSDSIVNKTLIGAAVNRSIGGRLPSEYVKTWRSKLGAAVFDEVLMTHAMDAELLARDQWHAFVLDRREKLRLLIGKACGGAAQPFSDATPLPDSSNSTAAT